MLNLFVSNFTNILIIINPFGGYMFFIKYLLASEGQVELVKDNYKKIKKDLFN